jgi:hypothetical protein
MGTPYAAVVANFVRGARVGGDRSEYAGGSLIDTSGLGPLLALRADNGYSVGIGAWMSFLRSAARGVRLRRFY